MAVSFGIQSWIEGGVITAVILINIIVGFLQEFQAEKTMDSLRSLSSPTAHAVRSGDVTTVPTAEIVPGGMLSLHIMLLVLNYRRYCRTEGRRLHPS
jgi:Na+-exporting ATPase